MAAVFQDRFHYTNLQLAAVYKCTEVQIQQSVWIRLTIFIWNRIHVHEITGIRLHVIYPCGHFEIA